MKTVRIGLLLLAAMALTAPLGAEEINAPDAHWQTAATDQPAPATGAQVDGNAPAVAQNTAQPAAPPDSLQTPKPAGQGETQHEKAQEQLKEEEKQRVAGVLPSFNVSYRSDAVSLTGWQKMSLAFKTSTDVITIATAIGTAGYHEALDDIAGLPWGTKGFAERSGVAYLDSFDGTMIGNGILPALLHQDPRYFRLGHGSVMHRILYSAASSVICKHDNTGKWEPNYSNVLGNVAAGGIATLYYPSGDSGVGLVFSTAMIQTATGGFGNIAQEFWPDISRKLLHKDPTHGLDAQYKESHQPAGEQKKDQP